MEKSSPSRQEARIIFQEPIRFFKFATESVPYDYQAQILLDQSKRLLMVAGRQVGKSTILALKALHEAATKQDRQVLIISSSQRQSNIIMDRIRQCFNRQPFFSSILENESAVFLKFKDGSSIWALPPGDVGATIRGFSPNLLIFDEAAYINDAVFDAMFPSVSRTGGSIILSGTPWGTRGLFYRLYESIAKDGALDWKKYKIESWDCPDISKEHLQSERNRMTENEYLQEYHAVFIENLGGFFDRDLILRNVLENISKDLPAERDYFLGVDIARMGNDETVFTIAERQPDGTFHIVKQIATIKTALTDTIGRIKSLQQKWNFKRIYADETGLGGGVADVIREANLPITPITFTLENKTLMYNNLRWLFENMKIKIPMDERLINQLVQLQAEYTSNQMLKIHHPEGGHDDLADSLALAVFAGSKPEPFMGIRGARI